MKGTEQRVGAPDEPSLFARSVVGTEQSCNYRAVTVRNFLDRENLAAKGEGGRETWMNSDLFNL